MTMLWADPFDQLGGNIALLPAAGYSGGTQKLSSASPGRTGNYAIKMASGSGGVWGNLQRVVNVPATTLGFAIGFRADSLPDRTGGFIFKLGASTALYIRATPTLGFEAIGVASNTANPPLGATANNVIKIGVWHWVQCKCIIDTVTPANNRFEMRIDRNTVLVMNGFNYPGGITAFDTVAALCVGNAWSDFTVDEFYIFDGNGTDNNDFPGLRTITYSPPNSDSTMQWTPTGQPTGWQATGEAPPVTTDYIEATAVNNIAEMQKTALTVNANSIAGVRLIAYAKALDASGPQMRLGLNSASFVTNGPALTIGSTYSYYDSIIERDPNGNIPLTKAAFDASLIRATRTL